MSDGGRKRASLEVEVWKSSQKWNAQRSAVRSIAWLDGSCGIRWRQVVAGFIDFTGLAINNDFYLRAGIVSLEANSASLDPAKRHGIDGHRLEIISVRPLGLSPAKKPHSPRDEFVVSHRGVFTI